MRIKQTRNIILLIVLIIAFGKMIEFLIYDDFTSARATIHDMYEEEDNIDVLFLGSSHTYASFDTEYLDDAMELNTFNLGTGDQQLDGSLLLLKEAVKHHNIKYVYLDMYYRIALDSPYKARTGAELGYCYTVSDSVRWSLDKGKYLLDISSPDDYVMNFIPARRRWEFLFDAKYIYNNVSKKMSEEYRTYQSPAEGLLGHGVYKRKGYIAIQNANLPEVLDGYSTQIKSLEDINPDWVISLQEIIDFCKDNDIMITLITVPMPEFLLAQSEKYDEYIEMVSNIADKNEIEYWDFNLCKGEVLSFDKKDYYDMTHLRQSGTEKFDVLFANLVNENVSPEEVFYSSYIEKLNNEPLQVYGFVLDREDGGEMHFVPISNDMNGIIQYQVTNINVEQAETDILIFYGNELKDYTFEAGNYRIIYSCDGRKEYCDIWASE